MDKPLTREEDADELLQLHTVLRSAVAKHHNSRLELFFQLQFPAERHESDDKVATRLGWH